LKRAVTNRNDSPDTACRPFDVDAAGSVFGEAGAVVTLESLDHARSRGAKILAEVAGIGQSHNIHPVYTRMEPDGTGIRIAVQKALADAEIGPEQLDLIIPHGTGVPNDDLAEARALQAALGPAAGRIPVWPTKSMLSTTGAAAGAIDVIAAVRAMNSRMIPPARNFTKPAPGCNLNIVTQRRDGGIRHALVCSHTFGGQTAAVVLKAFEGEATK
jgi:3-oxoacyl-[acyl-carrier-protein] synthase II